MLSISNATRDFNFVWWMHNDVMYATAKEVATSLGYKNTARAILDLVDSEYKHKAKDMPILSKNRLLDGSDYNVVYLSEPGLYQLIFKCHLPIAKEYQKWLFEEVLPSITATGSYTLPKTIKKQICINNETDLHYKVVDWIRNRYPQLIMVPGLGELQQTSLLRSNAYYKGYKGGQPDLIILGLHKTYIGLALEFKSPQGTGELSNNQAAYPKKLKQQNYKTLVSDDYDEILITIHDYAMGVRVKCDHWCKNFKNATTLTRHRNIYHRGEPTTEL